MRLPKNILSDSYRPPAIYLCQTNKDRIGELNVRNFEGTFKWVDYSEISFDIDRKVNNEAKRLIKYVKLNYINNCEVKR